MEIRDIVREDLFAVLKEYVTVDQILIEQPKIKSLGDYSVPCFSYAKILHKSPNDIAIMIKEKLNSDNYTKIDVVNGYLNLTVSDKLLNDKLRDMFEHEKFDLTMPTKEELYFLDYGGPNVAKPLHVGHLRTAIVGESIKRIIP